jgi:hypothetical protein
MQELGHIDAGERGTDEHLAVLVEDEPRVPRRIVSDEAAAGVRANGLIDGPHPEPGLVGAGKRLPDGRDLRLGEDHTRGEGPARE